MRRAVGALLAALSLAVAGCGGGDDPPRPEPTPTVARTPVPDTQIVEGDGELAVGITEPNPAFVWPAAARDVPEPFARWRDRLARMRPNLYRLVVDWPSISSPDGLQTDTAKHHPGCMRDIQPCAGWAGVREQMQALAAAQKADPGRWEVMVVLMGTPEGLAAGPRGCERAGTEPRSRPPADGSGIAAYGRLVTRLVEESRSAGLRIRYWSPWNEPNHPFFISPQRSRCSPRGRPAAVGSYVALAREMRRALELEDGDHELVLGELAGLLERSSKYVNVPDFIARLPRDVVCGATVWGQHGYVGGPNPVDEAAEALARRGCRRTHEVWVTETGAGAPRSGEDRRDSARALRRACRKIRGRLKDWYDDPRVTAAFQYTLREDDRFPTGLVTVDLARAYPSLAEWVAWGRREAPQAPPPPSTC